MTDIVYRRRIHEDPLDGRRLGRHVHHDPRSREFDAETAKAIVSVNHAVQGLPLNQGNVGCHDAATEVLTGQGWKSWPTCDGSEALGTINPKTGELQYQAPTAMHRYAYEGEMHVVDHSRLNYAITPNHRMWVRRWNERTRKLSTEFEFVEADALGWYVGLQHAPSGYTGAELQRVSIGGRSYDGDDLLGLIALIASDGWVGATESNQNTLSFCCFRRDRRDMVAALAQTLQIGELPGRPGVWKWTDPALAEWVRANLYVGETKRALHKRIPSLVQVASQRQIEHFLRFFGDQHTSGDRRAFYSSSHQIVDDLQILLLKTGARSSVYEREARTSVMTDGRAITGTGPDLTLTEATTSRLSIERKKDTRTVDYDGEVFCATVPNGLLVTRRERQVLISGNSCTGEALTAAGNAQPNLKATQSPRGQKDALRLYHDETVLEGSPWPPNDPGGSGLMVCRAAKKRGWLKSYRHAFGLEAALRALVRRPAIFGVDWYDSFDTPDKNGLVQIGSHASVRGGHEICALQIIAEHELVGFAQSWGDQYGVPNPDLGLAAGAFFMSFATLEQLLSQQGDCTVPVFA